MKPHESMRGCFAAALYEAMIKNPNIYLLVGDLGYGMFDNLREAFPDRFINCGASEFAMVAMACGLAYEGKIPFVYSITPFVLYRPFELLRTYIDHEKIPVKLIGSGRDDDYHVDGYSHNASDAMKILDTLPNIKQYWPVTKLDASKMVEMIVSNGEPSFISLTRKV